MAKNYINDNNRWKSKGASMVEKAYGPSGFFDKVGNAISGVANTVGNVANTVGNALTGGGNDPQPSAGGGGGGLGLFPGLREKLQAMRDNAMGQMGMPGQGGDGQEVTVRGKIINDQFRPHFKGGFGAGMNYGDGPSINLKNLGGNLKDIIKGDPDVKKARIASREKTVALRQTKKTERTAIKQGEKTERVKARNK